MLTSRVYCLTVILSFLCPRYFAVAMHHHLPSTDELDDLLLADTHLGRQMPNPFDAGLKGMRHRAEGRMHDRQSRRKRRSSDSPSPKTPAGGAPLVDESSGVIPSRIKRMRDSPEGGMHDRQSRRKRQRSDSPSPKTPAGGASLVEEERPSPEGGLHDRQSRRKRQSSDSPSPKTPAGGAPLVDSSSYTSSTFLPDDLAKPNAPSNNRTIKSPLATQTDGGSLLHNQPLDVIQFHRGTFSRGGQDLPVFSMTRHGGAMSSPRELPTLYYFQLRKPNRVKLWKLRNVGTSMFACESDTNDPKTKDVLLLLKKCSLVLAMLPENVLSAGGGVVQVPLSIRKTDAYDLYLDGNLIFTSPTVRHESKASLDMPMRRPTRRRRKWSDEPELVPQLLPELLRELEPEPENNIVTFYKGTFWHNRMTLPAFTMRHVDYLQDNKVGGFVTYYFTIALSAVSGMHKLKSIKDHVDYSVVCEIDDGDPKDSADVMLLFKEYTLTNTLPDRVVAVGGGVIHVPLSMKKSDGFNLYLNGQQVYPPSPKSYTVTLEEHEFRVQAQYRSKVRYVSILSYELMPIDFVEKELEYGVYYFPYKSGVYRCNNPNAESAMICDKGYLDSTYVADIHQRLVSLDTPQRRAFAGAIVYLPYNYSGRFALESGDQRQQK